MGDPNGEAVPQRRLGWFRTPGPDDTYRAALRELADALREVNALVVDTTAPEETLRELASLASGLRDRLQAAPRGRVRTPFGQRPTEEFQRGFVETSPLIGIANPIAPPLEMWLEEDCVCASGTFGAAYEGPPGFVHGGFVAAALDDVLGATQSAAENPGMTATLTVRYLRPTPLHRELRFEGRLVGIDGRKISAVATLHADDVLCAEAEALFISVDFGTVQAREGAGQARGPKRQEFSDRS